VEVLEMRTFKDIKVGDIVIVYDEYSHDYNEHVIKVETIEYDKENVTEDNPDGMICYGTDLEEEEWGDDYITVVAVGNFVSIAEDKDRLEIS
jgi:3,4-dihydroxy-2-butanone 4-phosphate synthase